MRWNWALLYFSIAAPFAVYTWAYTSPASFLSIFAADALFKIALAFKMLQIPLAVLAGVKAGVNKSGLVFGIPLAIVGQILNWSFLIRCGRTRTYYGYELGVVDEEWIEGFPFSLGHSQYKGSLLSVIGAYFCVQPKLKVTLAVGLWVLCYIWLSIVESFPPGYLDK